MFNQFNGLMTRDDEVLWWIIIVTYFTFDAIYLHKWTHIKEAAHVFCTMPCHAMLFAFSFDFHVLDEVLPFLLRHTCAAVIGATNFAIYCSIQRQYFDTQSEQKWCCVEGAKVVLFDLCERQIDMRVWDEMHVRKIDYGRPIAWKNVTLISIFKRSSYHYRIELNHMLKLFVTNIFDEYPLLKKKLQFTLISMGFFSMLRLCDRISLGIFV